MVDEGGFSFDLTGSPTPSDVVVKAVAEAASVDPMELPPLSDVVDPDALDALFQEQGPSHVSFGYSGYDVELDSAGTVVVEERETE